MEELMFLRLARRQRKDEIRALIRRDRRLRDSNNPFDLPDYRFIKIFRLSREVAQILIRDLRPYAREQLRASAIPFELKVLIALRFYATGSYQLPVGRDRDLVVSQPSVSRCIKLVSDLMCRVLLPRWVRFPNSIEERALVKRGFMEKHGFPNVIGALDCTHVAIVAPPTNDPVYSEHLFVNRKGYHSINVQLICDAHMVILAANARYPGATHDSFIWRNCKIKEHLMKINAQNINTGWLLGDSGYPLEPWLITPVNNPEPGSPADTINRRHSSTRSTVERCNGLYKSRFRCTLKHRVMHYHPTNAGKIIYACAILHNMCLAYRVPEPTDEEPVVGDDLGVIHADPQRVAGGVANILRAGQNTRQLIINRYFS